MRRPFLILPVLASLALGGCIMVDETTVVGPAGDVAQFHRGVDWAPDSAPPYSAAVSHDGLVYLAGTLGFKPGTREVADGIKAQTELALQSIAENLDAHGADLSSVVTCTAYLTDMAEYGAFNEVYASYFPTDPPARTTVGVASLPLGAKVEIACVAAQTGL